MGVQDELPVLGTRDLCHLTFGKEDSLILLCAAVKALVLARGPYELVKDIGFGIFLTKDGKTIETAFLDNDIWKSTKK